MIPYLYVNFTRDGGRQKMKAQSRQIAEEAEHFAR
jgi:hypothetical protein